VPTDALPPNAASRSGLVFHVTVLASHDSVARWTVVSTDAGGGVLAAVRYRPSCAPLMTALVGIPERSSNANPSPKSPRSTTRLAAAPYAVFGFSAKTLVAAAGPRTTSVAPAGPESPIRARTTERRIERAPVMNPWQDPRTAIL
jgi:hypothetical protein